MPKMNEYEVEFLRAIAEDKPLPFGGGAGNAVIDFLQEFGYVDSQARITARGVAAYDALTQD